MTYTNKLKLEIISDFIWCSSSIAILALNVQNKINTIITIAFIIIIAVICQCIQIYVNKSWKHLWSISTLHMIIYFSSIFIMAIIMQIFDIWDYYLCFFYLLVAGHAVILDIEYYIKAKKYDMNNLNSIQELIEKYPETEKMINQNILYKLN